MSDPKLEIRDLLRNQWDQNNTSDITPKIAINSPDEVEELPQVAVATYDSNPINGGNTGYDGMSSDGPTQTVQGAIDVNTIATSESTSVDPQKLTTEMSEEVKRILTSYPLSTDLTIVGWGGKTEGNETNISPVRYRYICEATFTR